MKRASQLRKLKYRPRKVILKGRYYCPVIPSLGHYENEGMWGYDKLVHVEKNKYQIIQCLFNTEEERDEAYSKEYEKIMRLGKQILRRRSCFCEEVIDELEMECVSITDGVKIIEGKTVRLIV